MEQDAAVEASAAVPVVDVYVEPTAAPAPTPTEVGPPTTDARAADASASTDGPETDAPASENYEAARGAAASADEVSRGMVSTVGELPTKFIGLADAKLDDLQSGVYRKRTLSNASAASVDRALKTLGYEAENAATTSAVVGEANSNTRQAGHGIHSNKQGPQSCNEEMTVVARMFRRGWHTHGHPARLIFDQGNGSTWRGEDSGCREHCEKRSKEELNLQPAVSQVLHGELSSLWSLLCFRTMPRSMLPVPNAGSSL